jgi:hypothetical protein
MSEEFANRKVAIRHNTQLGEKERVCVYVCTDTDRILGFGHESMMPMFAGSYRTHVLYSAVQIDRWCDRYRAQEQEDMESDDYYRSMREAPYRKSIIDALLERRKVVSASDARWIDAQIVIMRRRHERMRKRQEERFLLCEKYDSNVRQEDIALDSPALKALRAEN